MREAVDEALKLETALARLRTPHRIALLHYAPIVATVEGEPPEIFPFLGCSRLEEPITRYPVTAVFHGHAHHGRPEGRTRNGVPVYNVSLPLLRALSPERPYRLIEITEGGVQSDRRAGGDRLALVARFERLLELSVSDPKSDLEVTSPLVSFEPSNEVVPLQERYAADRTRTIDTTSMQRPFCPPVAPRRFWTKNNGLAAIAASPSIDDECERRESNPHGLPHRILSPARLPVPPLARGRTGR